MIHTSGTSNMADQPISGTYLEDKTFDDEKDDIYAYEKMRNEKYAYAQRSAELGVIDAGLETGVKTIVIMSPTIYGIGTGHFNKSSIQVPAYAQVTIENGHGVIVGEGKEERAKNRRGHPPKSTRQHGVKDTAEKQLLDDWRHHHGRERDQQHDLVLIARGGRFETLNQDLRRLSLDELHRD